MNSKLIVWKRLDENKYGYLYIKDLNKLEAIAC